MEIWARSLDPQVPQWQGPGAEEGGLQTGHPTRLWGMEEGARANGEDITTWINSHGLRGDEPELPRPASRHRILTLGDSSFFGFLVSDEDVFTHQLERILRDKGIDVDVVNGGVAGYSIAQHRILMDEVGWDLEPTLIVYCNLWSDNTWDTFQDEDLLAARRFAELNPLVHSAAMRLLAAALSEPETQGGGRIIMWNGEQGWPMDKKRRVPLERYIALHDSVVRDAAARGIGGAYLIPTNSFMLSKDRDTATAPSWAPYFEALDRLGQHHDQPVVDLGSVFTDAMSRGLTSDELLMDLMHPSPAGHALIAQALAEALLASGWPDNALVGRTDPVVADDLKDQPPPRWTDDNGAGSSQRYLFDISEEEQEAIRKRAREMAEAGPPAPDGPGPDGVPDSVPAAEPPPGGAWPVRVKVSGGTPPYKVVIRDAQGRPVGSARMFAPAQVQLMMRVDLESVTAEVTDADGKVKTHPLTEASWDAVVDLGD